MTSKQKLRNRFGLYKYGTPPYSKDWWDATSHRIRSFGRLKEDWNSHGSGPVSKKSIRYALKVLKMFEDMNTPGLVVSPTGDESVLFEAGDLLIEVFDDSTVVYNKINQECEEFSNTINMVNRMKSAVLY